MFDIGWSELVVIGVVALIVIGPKELPAVLRTVGQWMGKIRRMASEFQGQFQEAMREAEIADLKKQVDDRQRHARPASPTSIRVDTAQKESKARSRSKPPTPATDAPTPARRPSPPRLRGRAVRRQ